MLLRIVSIVFPIFIIVMVGFAYGRKHRPDMQVANSLNISVFLPALFFSALAGKSFNLADHIPIALGCAVVVLGSGEQTLGAAVVLMLVVPAPTWVPGALAWWAPA